MALRNGLTSGTSLGTLAIALGALTLPLAAHAQDTATASPDQATEATPTADVDTQTSTDTVTAPSNEIVVTGFRASLAKSAAIKRNSTLIVDSVTAEDIGKLPDVSIADSLARLPGVTAQRLEGRDQRLSIRGLGPDFSTTLLNGREQVTVGDNRGVEYDQYPSEFFQTVNVYKSADASLISSGIAGTVDLRMLRPLAVNKRVFSIGARAEMNGIDKLTPDGTRYGYRGSATYVDQFANDTLGIALGVSASSIPSQDERYNAWGYSTATNGALELGGAKPYVQSNLLNRIGGVATIEWQPSDRFHSTLDILYSHFNEKQRFKGIEFPLGYGGVVNDPTDPGYATGVHTGGFTVVDGFNVQETFSNVHAVQRNDYNERKADNWSIGWNNVLKLNDKLNLTVDASWSRATRTDFLLETYTGAGYAKSGPGDTVNVTQQPDGTFRIVPTLDYTDTSIFKITDPQGWGYNGTTPVVQSGFLNTPDFTDDLKALRADLNGELDNAGIFSGWAIGANYSQRKKVSAFRSEFLCPPGGGTGCTVNSGTPTEAAIPDGALLGSNVPLDYLGVPGVLGLNPLYLYDNFFNSVYDNRPVSLVRDNSVTEKVWTGYAQLKIDGEAGGKAIKGSIGFQVVHTDQSSIGSTSSFNVIDGNPVVTINPASGGISYTNFLPSATFSVELEPGFYVKLGASQTMVRPRLDQERVNQEVDVDNSKVGISNPTQDPQFSPFSISGGNAELKPYQSTNIDVSVEKYFSRGGYISLAGYFKHLTDYVDAQASYAYDFSNFVSLLSPANQALVGNNTIGLVKAPANDGQGYLLGFEATASLPFETITPALSGFGIFASGSYTDSAIKLGSNPTQVITLPGLSDWVANAQLYYEKHGFQARVSYRYRSGFLGEVAGLSANPTYRQAKAEAILDAQIGYEFQSGPLQGLSILLEGKNLTDRPFVTYQNDDPRQVIDYQRYGRDYFIGLSYKF
ncbi:TonB-dependent receptor [Porphyrobacter algicida]|uniref:TonB-dependent receptor n=1 Tax=Qipengyuania algicida TaxID=1836209 RepID=A0A845AJZ8_9SPHN|nr:TonB-dependent receptor [Qipengyuania algicida]MXP29473.1 TonB-dependent receptor [Qipengyuania algicida]